VDAWQGRPPAVDMVLCLSVEPGFGGQSLMHSVLPKVSELRQRCPELDIQIDGGINLTTVEAAATVGRCRLNR